MPFAQNWRIFVWCVDWKVKEHRHRAGDVKTFRAYKEGYSNEGNQSPLVPFVAALPLFAKRFSRQILVLLHVSQCVAVPSGSERPEGYTEAENRPQRLYAPVWH